MRLVIVSHTPHYKNGGIIRGWGPTIREIDYLGRLFSEITHIAPLHSGKPPASMLPYSQPNISFVGVPIAGGPSFRDKLRILSVYPRYARTISAYSREADAIHLRCPANIALLGLLMLVARRTPHYRWYKFAGNWQPIDSEPLSYKIQRLILAGNLGRGIVTINGRWNNQPRHVVSFVNPSLTRAETENAIAITANKYLTKPTRFIFVGETSENKGLGIAIRVIGMLTKRGHDVLFDVVGDGASRTLYEQLVVRLGLDNQITFHGWVPRAELGPYYRAAHFILLPSQSEGWPKVLSEAMTYRVVPIASAVSCIPQVLGDIGCGVSLPPKDEEYVEQIEAYLANPTRWHSEQEKGQRAGYHFTYEHYVAQLQRVFRQAWGIGSERA